MLRKQALFLTLFRGGCVQPSSNLFQKCHGTRSRGGCMHNLHATPISERVHTNPISIPFRGVVHSLMQSSFQMGLCTLPFNPYFTGGYIQTWQNPISEGSHATQAQPPFQRDCTQPHFKGIVHNPHASPNSKGAAHDPMLHPCNLLLPQLARFYLSVTNI